MKCPYQFCGGKISAILGVNNFGGQIINSHPIYKCACFDILGRIKKIKISNFVKFSNFEIKNLQKQILFYFKENVLNKKSPLRVRFQHLKNMHSFNSIYTYPDEDLCLFKDFPTIALCSQF